jgi:hypothetical protein
MGGKQKKGGENRMSNTTCDACKKKKNCELYVAFLCSKCEKTHVVQVRKIEKEAKRNTN